MINQLKHLMEQSDPASPTLLQVQLPNPSGIAPHELFDQELRRLALGDNLVRRLREIDSGIPGFDRYFVLGCGRSGTWLLMQLLSTLRDQDIVPKELPVEAFGIFATRSSRLLIKRHFLSYRTIRNIPPNIRLIYIIRNPYDVLTSHNPVTKREYHIEPARWLEEMQAFADLIASGRENLKILRYEDLVADPTRMQAELADFLQAEIATNPHGMEFSERIDEKTRKAMHGVRRIDTNSVEKYRSDPAKVEYLRKIIPLLKDRLSWVAERFDYQMDL